jgi:aspartate racemase
MTLFAGARLGVLGGMGPSATVDFLGKLIAATPATMDQDHLPLVLYSTPQIPDRTAAILGIGPSPLELLIQGVCVLEKAGATHIAMPCNTAHHWLEALRAASSAPFLSMVDAVRDGLEVQGDGDHKIGVISTAGAEATNLYGPMLSSIGCTRVAPSAPLQRKVDRAVRAVKAGRTDDAVTIISPVVAELQEAGVRRVVLGCSELPLIPGLRGDLFFDATEALAKACVKTLLNLGTG